MFSSIQWAEETRSDFGYFRMKSSKAVRAAGKSFISSA
jgi:hypothetical protein